MIDIEKQISQILDEYADDVATATSEAVKKVGKEAVKKLKNTSPKGATGKYSKGWTYSVEKSRLHTSVTVHGKSGTYQLAHLLEKPHAKRGGGRTKPQEHIAPVEEWVIDEVETQITEKVKQL